VLIDELAAAARPDDGDDRLRAFVACMLDFFWRRRQLAVLMHRYEHRLREPEGVEWRARRARLVAIARALVIRRLGRPRDATLATELLLAMIRAAILNHRDGEQPDAVAAVIVGVFLNGATSLPAKRARVPAATRAAGVRR